MSRKPTEFAAVKPRSGRIRAGSSAARPSLPAGEGGEQDAPGRERAEYLGARPAGGVAVGRAPQTRPSTARLIRITPTRSRPAARTLALGDLASTSGIRDEADGHVDPEDPLPGQAFRHHSADHRAAQYGEAGDRAEHAQRAPRRSGGNAAPSRAIASGITSGGPTPCAARAAISQGTEVASAQPTDAAVNTPSPRQRSVGGRSGHRSRRRSSEASRSSGRTRSPSTRAGSEAPRSARMVVSAAATTSTSSATISDAADVSASVHFCLLVNRCLLVGMSIGTDQRRRRTTVGPGAPGTVGPRRLR